MTRKNLDSDLMLENSLCPMGCPGNDVFVFRGEDKLYGLPGAFNVVSCCQCGLMRVDPRPTLEGMKSYYPEEYSPFSAIAEQRNKQNISSQVSKAVKNLFDFKDHLLPNSNPGRLLEIGCGSGAFLQEMASKGWDVQGIEPSVHAAEIANKNGLSVHCGTLNNYQWDGDPFDICAAWMVLEHLHNPVEVLQLIARMVKKMVGYASLSQMPAHGSSKYSRMIGMPHNYPPICII